MCGRYTSLTADEITEVRSIIKDISLKLARDESDSHQTTPQEVAPTNRVPIITSSEGTLSFEHAKFGFKRWDGKGVIINARAETINQKSMFKGHVHARRCVIPASGYYEWKAEVAQRKKTKHLIKGKQGNLMFMAGLYRDGADGCEFVIITKDPVGDIADIHDRMPVILKVEQIGLWLSGAMPVEGLVSLDYECIAKPCETPEVHNNGYKQLTLFEMS